MAWSLEQSSLSGDLAIKVDLCITLAAFLLLHLYKMVPGFVLQVSFYYFFW